MALVAYDGSDFCGFQVQRDVPTIQGALEQSLAAFSEPVGRIAGAGRTDTGVHARGQVIAGAAHWKHGWAELQRAWNAHLPAAIVVRRVVAEPPPSAGGKPFHPRFSAACRSYRYTVVAGNAAEAPARSPLHGRYAHVEANPLDVAAMQQAAQLLVGTHDFASFGKPPDGESTVRTVTMAQWQQLQTTLPALEAAPESTLVFTVTANAFLQHMVRRLVGTLLEVGRSRMSVEAFGAALAACDGRMAAPPAFAGGLVLEQVTYAPEWGLHLVSPLDADA